MPRTATCVENVGESPWRAAARCERAFLGDSPAAIRIKKLLERLARSDVIALLEGETGVGKTFLARLVHEAGRRARSPLLVVNCAALPDALIESEMFGHQRGAFTGAVAARAGVFEAARAGTVLLDEIGDLTLASQSKLLHVLESKIFTRLGSTQPITLEARVLAATNRDLERMVEEGTFRRDLFYRIGVVRVRVPPLREREDDLILLAHHVLADLSARSHRSVDGFTGAALDAIRRYPWPGNVRELRNVLEHALVLGDEPLIDVAELPEAVRDRTVAPATPPARSAGGAVSIPVPTDTWLVELPATLEWLEAQAITAALTSAGGNKKRAASILGIDRATLHRKLRSYKR